MKLLLSLGLSFWTALAFATDSEPHQKVKLCNPAETFCTDVTAGSRAKVDADVTSSVLPTGAATATNQSTANTSLSSIDTKLSSQATAANQSTAITSLQLIDNPVGSISGGTAGTSSFAAGAIYRTTLPTLTNGQQVALQVDEQGRLITSGVSEFLSPLPGFVARSAKVLSAGATSYSTYVMSADIAIVDFHFGGRGPGQAAIFRLNPAATAFVPSGNFETTNDVTVVWTNTGIGDEAAIAWVRSTAQFTTGTSSAAQTFTKSDSNNYSEITYTWSTPQDSNAWRYISADVRVTVAAGGSVSRTVSIILEDVNAATRSYTITGTTTTAPFSTEQWQTITGEIASPTSSTGTFDSYNVSKVHLRLMDGGNKTGTIYWDNVHFDDSQELIERIYIDANRTFQLILNPVELFDVGETLALRFTNNDTVSREFTVTAKGVER